MLHTPLVVQRLQNHILSLTCVWLLLLLLQETEETEETAESVDEELAQDWNTLSVMPVSGWDSGGPVEGSNVGEVASGVRPGLVGHLQP